MKFTLNGNDFYCDLDEFMKLCESGFFDRHKNGNGAAPRRALSQDADASRHGIEDSKGNTSTAEYSEDTHAAIAVERPINAEVFFKNLSPKMAKIAFAVYESGGKISFSELTRKRGLRGRRCESQTAA